MTAPKHVLILRTCNADMSSHGGFVWPESGPVTCPDWKPLAECGNGLHGALFGEGDGGLLNFSTDAKWLVVKVLAADIIDLGGKVKFPGGEVVHCGDQLTATTYLGKRAPGRAIIGGTATAGYGGTATAGHRGTATAGDRGTATAGHGGTATAGHRGTVELRWYDDARDRYRVTIGYIGENGLTPGTAYRCDEQGRIIPAATT